MGHWLFNFHVVSGPGRGWQPSTLSLLPTCQRFVLVHADELSVYQLDDILEGIFHILHLLFKVKQTNQGTSHINKTLDLWSWCHKNKKKCQIKGWKCSSNSVLEPMNYGIFFNYVSTGYRLHAPAFSVFWACSFAALRFLNVGFCATVYALAFLSPMPDFQSQHTQL